MSLRIVMAARVLAGVLAGAGTAAAAPPMTLSPFVKALDDMMVSLAADSARAGASIRHAYRQHLDLLMLHAYSDVEGALENGGLVPLPDDPAAYNLAPRMKGPHPIGEKDLEHQSSYLSARAATIGALIEIAAQVKSGPVEITSLVRHGHYQDELRATNANATTSVPMHTLGLAFDIGLVNSRLDTVHEIRDVLRRMQRRGDILFVGERRQLVFHVVPHPARLGHFADVYMRKVGMPPTSRVAHVVATLPGPRPTRALTPTVTAEALAFLPAVAPVTASGPADEEGVSAMAATVTQAADSVATLVRRWFVLLVALAAATWRIAAPPRLRPAFIDLGAERS